MIVGWLGRVSELREAVKQKVCNLMNNKKAINLSVTVIISEDVNLEKQYVSCRHMNCLYVLLYF